MNSGGGGDQTAEEAGNHNNTTAVMDGKDGATDTFARYNCTISVLIKMAVVTWKCHAQYNALFDNVLLYYVV